jgi:hypothetical protein
MIDPNDSAGLEDLRKLYPHLTYEELETAQDNIRRYLEVLIRMEERLHEQGKSLNDLPENPAISPPTPN